VSFDKVGTTAPEVPVEQLPLLFLLTSQELSFAKGPDPVGVEDTTPSAEYGVTRLRAELISATCVALDRAAAVFTSPICSGVPFDPSLTCSSDEEFSAWSAPMLVFDNTGTLVL
jgi:hypothetical protein